MTRQRNAEINLGAYISFKSQGCRICGEEGDYRVIEAHHLDPSRKRFTLGSKGALNRDPLDYAAEIAACVPLCPTCHRKVEVGILQIPEGDES